MNINLSITDAFVEDAALLAVLEALAGTRAPEHVENAKAAEPKRPKGKPATANPEFEAAVSTMIAESPIAQEKPAKEAPAPEKKAVTFAVVAKAASAALNAGKRDGFAAILEARGAKALKDVPEGDYPAVLAEIEAL